MPSVRQEAAWPRAEGSGRREPGGSPCRPVGVTATPEEGQECGPCLGSWSPPGLTSERPVGEGRREARLTRGGPGKAPGDTQRTRDVPRTWDTPAAQQGLSESRTGEQREPRSLLLCQAAMTRPHTRSGDVGVCSWGKLGQTSHTGAGTRCRMEIGASWKISIPAGESGPPCPPAPGSLCPCVAPQCSPACGDRGPVLLCRRWPQAKTHGHCVCSPRHSRLLSSCHKAC